MRLRRYHLQAAASRSPPACMGANSSYECALVKMLAECRNECVALDCLEPWYPTKDWDIAVTFYRPSILPMLLSNHNHAVKIELRIADCHNCQQSVVDCA